RLVDRQRPQGDGETHQRPGGQRAGMVHRRPDGGGGDHAAGDRWRMTPAHATRRSARMMHAGADGSADMSASHSVDERADLIGDRDDLYLRWSSGPDADE